uniref:Uncharacterized protein n=1 Tax=Arundo donax TaxID=35708 RepID=A0A0A8XXB2_ARUDO
MSCPSSRRPPHGWRDLGRMDPEGGCGGSRWEGQPNRGGAWWPVPRIQRIGGGGAFHSSAPARGPSRLSTPPQPRLARRVRSHDAAPSGW